MKLRQSTINEYMTCSYRVGLRNEHGYRAKGSVPRTLGTGYHAALAKGYMLIREGIDPEEHWDDLFAAACEDMERDIEMATDGYDWRYQVKNARSEEIIYNWEDMKDLVHGVIHFYRGRWWPSDRYTVLGVEQPFNLPFPARDDITRFGTMDLVVQDQETGWVHVIDHKLTKRKWSARKAEPSESVQATWYVAAARDLYNTEHVTFTYDVMTHDGGFQRIDAHRTNTHISATNTQASLVADAILKGGPFIPNTSSFLCHEAYCDWWEVCPFGRALKS